MPDPSRPAYPSAGDPTVTLSIEGFVPVALEPADEVPAEPSPARPTDRYVDLGPLGEGGMGEVRRVRDRELNRVLAMKLVRLPLVSSTDALARFLEEAQATAQLQHPNIVPIHDVGRLPDGRLWFTMKEVRGATLLEVLREVHAASTERWESTPSGWSFHGLVGALHSVCNAVGYAHERGVVHRDLKPANVMVGRLGEVYVLDWGLAKLTGRVDTALDEPIETRRSQQTRMGHVSGTPAYMPPEQARGDVDRIDARSDVYALGAMLYELLTGRPPFHGTATEVVAAVCAGPPERPSHPRLPLPDALVDVCLRAMARDPEDRHVTAVALAEDLQGWLDGRRRREHALALVDRALAGEAESQAALARAASLRTEARALLKDLAPWQPEEEKAPGWAMEALAEAEERAARLGSQQVDEGLQAALRIESSLPEAHAAIASRLQGRHAEAEARRDRDGSLGFETLLATHAEALPVFHPVRREVSAYLRGDGALTLLTDPPGAEVLLFRYVERNRRLVEVFERTLGPTPLLAVPLSMGSYLCVLRHPDRAEVRYPVEITRQGHWDGVPPGEAHPLAVPLPRAEEVRSDERYVAPGWFTMGGPAGGDALARGRVWCDGFVIHTFPVTNREYIAFLDALVDAGREAEALTLVPRTRGGGGQGADGLPLYGRTQRGHFLLQPDAEGDVWDLEWPAIMIDWRCAVAYANWRAAVQGRPYRLPAELEWEKASRGVDGRLFPWGENHDPTWCNMRDSHRGRQLPSVVRSFPVDESAYGVRGMGGNVWDWCLDPFQKAGPPIDRQRVVVPRMPEVATIDPWAKIDRPNRGGTWNGLSWHSRCGDRLHIEQSARLSVLGFRLARTFPVRG